MSEPGACERPSFLKDFRNELNKHRECTSRNAKVLSKVEEIFERDVRDATSKCPWEALQKELLSSIHKKTRELSLLQTKVEKVEQTIGSLSAEYQALLYKMTERQDEFVALSQESHQKMERCQNLKREYEEMQSKTRNLYDAIRTSKCYYKKNLGCHVQCVSSDDNGATYLLRFGSTDKSDEQDMPNMSVKLHNDPSGKWTLLETRPILSAYSQLAKKLAATQDISGLIAFVRQEMLKS